MARGAKTRLWPEEKDPAPSALAGSLPGHFWQRTCVWQKRRDLAQGHELSGADELVRFGIVVYRPTEEPQWPLDRASHDLSS